MPNNTSLNPTASVSLEAWIYPRLPLNPVAPPIIKKAGEGLGQQDGYALELSGSGALLFGVYVTGGKGWCIASSALLTPNQWTHVVGVYDGTNVLLYANGMPSRPHLSLCAWTDCALGQQSSNRP